METCNFTGGSVASFWLVGFPSLQDHQFPLFFVFLVFYLLILSSNVTIIVAVATDPKLHKPMYFFLTNLSILDILLTTITIPRMLAMFLIKAKSVSSQGCFLQMYFFHGLAVTETFLLVVMPYDRYEAVCHPLHYTARMTKQKNLRLAAGAWFSALLVHIQPVVQLSQLTFGKTPRVNHCFCDHWTTCPGCLPKCLHHIPEFSGLYHFYDRRLWSTAACGHLLRLHHGLGLADQVQGRPQEDLLHLLLPPGGGHHVLFLHRSGLSLLPRQDAQRHPRSERHDFCHFNSFGQPSHLHSEEQGHQEGSETAGVLKSLLRAERETPFRPSEVQGDLKPCFN